MKNMEVKALFDEGASFGATDFAVRTAEYALKVLVVYEDTVSEVWAAQFCHRATRAIGPEGLNLSLWRMGSLTQPDLLPRAVQAAAQADVLVVALRGADELPLDLCVWIDVWLPRRYRQPGVLVALIDRPEQSCFSFSRTEEYLRAVARKGSLDFMPQERKMPLGSETAWMPRIAT